MKFSTQEEDESDNSKLKDDSTGIEIKHVYKLRQRQTQSCDRCKSKKRKCDGNNPCGKII